MDGWCKRVTTVVKIREKKTKNQTKQMEQSEL